MTIAWSPTERQGNKVKHVDAILVGCGPPAIWDCRMCDHHAAGRSASFHKPSGQYRLVVMKPDICGERTHRRRTERTTRRLDECSERARPGVTQGTTGEAWRVEPRWCLPALRQRWPALVRTAGFTQSSCAPGCARCGKAATENGKFDWTQGEPATTAHVADVRRATDRGLANGVPFLTEASLLLTNAHMRAIRRP